MTYLFQLLLLLAVARHHLVLRAHHVLGRRGVVETEESQRTLVVHRGTLGRVVRRADDQSACPSGVPPNPRARRDGSCTRAGTELGAPARGRALSASTADDAHPFRRVHAVRSCPAACVVTRPSPPVGIDLPWGNKNIGSVVLIFSASCWPSRFPERNPNPESAGPSIRVLGARRNSRRGKKMLEPLDLIECWCGLSRSADHTSPAAASGPRGRLVVASSRDIIGHE